MHLVIRADGGPDIGYGHLIRSKSLIDEMQRKDFETTVATTTPESARSVLPKAVKIVELSSRGDPKPFQERLDSDRPDVVFTDAYPVDTKYQRAIRNRAPLAVLQDDNRHAVCADLFVNGNIYAESMEYEFIGEEPTTCLGTDYVLLRSEVRNQARGNPPWREQPDRALITMGGSDMRNLTPTVLRAFDRFDLRVNAIVGPGVSQQNEREIRTVATDVSVDVTVSRDPYNLPQLMFDADIAVSTASSTIYELFIMGTPIIACAVAENQYPIANALKDYDLATVVDHSDGLDAFADAIGEYISDHQIRGQRRNKGRDLVDGRGAERVADELEALAEEKME